VSRSSSALDPGTAWWTESRSLQPQRTQRFPSRSLAARLSRCQAERLTRGARNPTVAVGRSGGTALVSQRAERRHSWGRGGPARCPTELVKAVSYLPTPHGRFRGHRHKESLCLGVDKRSGLAAVMPNLRERAHRARRRRWAPLVEAGVVRCTRCGELIRPGEPWDLGHVDGSERTVYSGPEHRRCNRATNTHRRTPHTRRW
jgi:hypothetical protein